MGCVREAEEENCREREEELQGGGRREEEGGRKGEGAALQMGSAEGWVFKAYLNIITFKILNIVSIQMESWGGKMALVDFLYAKVIQKRPSVIKRYFLFVY